MKKTQDDFGEINRHQIIEGFVVHGLGLDFTPVAWEALTYFW